MSASAEQRLFTVGLVGGPYDGERRDLPPECPCCGKPIEKTGAIWTGPDGSRYMLDPDFDTEHALFLDQASA